MDHGCKAGGGSVRNIHAAIAEDALPRKETFIFQPPIFRGASRLVSGRVSIGGWCHGLGNASPQQLGR